LVCINWFMELKIKAKDFIRLIKSKNDLSF